jgi:hypothetical protein
MHVLTLGSPKAHKRGPVVSWHNGRHGSDLLCADDVLLRGGRALCLCVACDRVHPVEAVGNILKLRHRSARNPEPAWQMPRPGPRGVCHFGRKGSPRMVLV